MPTAAEILAREIKTRGSITFARFMEVALYCPLCGFYEAEEDKIGKSGDFYTSASVGGVFGELVAFQAGEWFAGGPDGAAEVQLVEAGAHRATVAKDILSWLKSYEPQLFHRLTYVLLEPSKRRRRWQEETLAAFGAKVVWMDGPEALAASTSKDPLNQRILFCNELLDAMPVHRFAWDSRRWCWIEWGVGLSGKEFCWVSMAGPKEAELPFPEFALNGVEVNPETFASALLGELAAAAVAGRHVLRVAEDWAEFGALFSALPDGFILEVSPRAEAWWRQACKSVLPNGRLLTFDYGFRAEQFLVPERKGGTLRAYRDHKVSADVLANPGEQDLTAHVNFSAIRRAGEEVGLATESLVTQERFLGDVARRAWHTHERAWDPAKTRQFRTLTHPEYLGATFQVLVQSTADPDQPGRINRPE